MDEQFLKTQLRGFLNSEGQLTKYPTKQGKKMLALFYLAAKFVPGEIYTEKEVNEILKAWHTFSDWAMLRRDLFDRHFLARESNGTAYRLEDPQPTPAQLGIAGIGEEGKA